MNPAEQAAHKESEFGINASRGIRPRILTGRVSPSRPTKALLIDLRIHEWLTIIGKDCESAGGH